MINVRNPRWNFIFDDKYDTRNDDRYHRLTIDGYQPRQTHPSAIQAAGRPGADSHLSHYQGQQAEGNAAGYLHEIEQEVSQEKQQLEDQLTDRAHKMQKELTGRMMAPFTRVGRMSCQLVRSACKWSNGTPTEHSVANAYAKLIQSAQHFVYIENQFFITATGTHQDPVKNNLIGSALVERILRAARSGQKFKVIVVMPAIPAFAGDLKDDAALGTRAIMELATLRYVLCRKY